MELMKILIKLMMDHFQEVIKKKKVINKEKDPHQKMKMHKVVMKNQLVQEVRKRKKVETKERKQKVKKK